MVNVFSLDMTPDETGLVLRVDHSKFHCTYTEGSYTVLPARLLGISYADFLRLCRDEFDAEIFGRGTLYPVPYFRYTEKSKALVTLLNSIARQVLFARENPDYFEHKAAVDEFYKARYPEYTDLITWREQHNGNVQHD